tara:strand:- start:282 stop:539 length:258 start_codon:yes stop_codon:yes gene_type:complete
MKFFVYLIIAKRKKSYISYVGYTNNLKKRIKLHNLSKGAKFTKGNNWSLIYAKSYDTKRIAMSEEYKLKKNVKLRSKLKKKYLNR